MSYFYAYCTPSGEPYVKCPVSGEFAFSERPSARVVPEIYVFDSRHARDVFVAERDDMRAMPARDAYPWMRWHMTGLWESYDNEAYQERRWGNRVPDDRVVSHYLDYVDNDDYGVGETRFLMGESLTFDRRNNTVSAAHFVYREA